MHCKSRDETNLVQMARSHKIIQLVCPITKFGLVLAYIYGWLNPEIVGYVGVVAPEKKLEDRQTNKVMT